MSLGLEYEIDCCREVVLKEDKICIPPPDSKLLGSKKKNCFGYVEHMKFSSGNTKFEFSKDFEFKKYHLGLNPQNEGFDIPDENESPTAEIVTGPILTANVKINKNRKKAIKCLSTSFLICKRNYKKFVKIFGDESEIMLSFSLSLFGFDKNEGEYYTKLSNVDGEYLKGIVKTTENEDGEIVPKITIEKSEKYRRLYVCSIKILPTRRRQTIEFAKRFVLKEMIWKYYQDDSDSDDQEDCPDQE